MEKRPSLKLSKKRTEELVLIVLRIMLNQQSEKSLPLSFEFLLALRYKFFSQVSTSEKRTFSKTYKKENRRGPNVLHTLLNSGQRATD